jgi:hypothetical protein
MLVDEQFLERQSASGAIAARSLEKDPLFGRKTNSLIRRTDGGG